jgi:ankyrin repeat protein
MASYDVASNICESLTFVDVVVQLIAAGADVDATSYGITPLCMAVEAEHEDVAERLIAAGANVNLASPDMHTPLLLAAAIGSMDMVDWLIAAGADVNVACSGADGSVPLNAAVARGTAGVQ